MNKGIELPIDKIAVKSLCFSYNNYKNILEELDFTINEHEKVLIDGPSGCGKSTICKLLYRTLSDYKGQINFNNLSEKNFNLQKIRTDILYVGQEENLFTGTIKDNITCFREVRDEELLKIINICKVDEIIEKRPNKLETIINAASNNLSGGEKQRIILARGLLKKANIIILDEALSEVNLTLEKNIIDNILNNFKDKTIIYVSHKNVQDKFTKIIKLEANNG